MPTPYDLLLEKIGLKKKKDGSLSVALPKNKLVELELEDKDKIIDEDYRAFTKASMSTKTSSKAGAKVISATIALVVALFIGFVFFTAISQIHILLAVPISLLFSALWFKWICTWIYNKLSGI